MKKSHSFNSAEKPSIIRYTTQISLSLLYTCSPAILSRKNHLPHTHHQPQRFPQEPLTRLQFILIQLKLIPAEDERNNQRQLHLCYVAADTASWAVGEGNESLLLPGRRLSASRKNIGVRSAYLSVNFSHRSGRNSSASLPQISLL